MRWNSSAAGDASRYFETNNIAGLILKQGEISGVKYAIYHSGKKVAADQYTDELKDNGATLTLNITAADKGYYGAKTLKFTILSKWTQWIFG